MRLFRKRFARLRMIVAKAHHFTVEERKEFSVYFNIYENNGDLERTQRNTAD